MPSIIMKKMGSTKAASAISEPRVPVTCFLSRDILIETTLELLLHARGRARLHDLCAETWLYRSRCSPHPPAAVQNHRDCYGHAKWNFYQVWIIQRQVGAGQVHGEESGQHASQIAQGFAQALFPDNHYYSHQTIYQNSKHQHGEKIFRA